MSENFTKVGLGVMIWKDGKVLLGKRKGKHAPGVYAFPGGHLEYMESFEDCVRREVAEETGMEVENIKFLLVGNAKLYAPKHYVQVNFTADWKSGEPQNLEPDKCEGWDWYDVDNLPSPTMMNSFVCFESYKTGKNYFPDIS